MHRERPQADALCRPPRAGDEKPWGGPAVPHEVSLPPPTCRGAADPVVATDTVPGRLPPALPAHFTEPGRPWATTEFHAYAMTLAFGPGALSYLLLASHLN